MSNQWEDDDFFDGDEETDMGDEALEESQNVKRSEPVLISSRETVSAPVKTTQVNREDRPLVRKRKIRIKPMPSSMQNRWPDVVSCLLTLASGRQVMFVKG